MIFNYKKLSTNLKYYSYLPSFTYFRSEFLWMLLAISRSSAKGETKLQIATIPPSAIILATSATLRIFSSRSAWLNPRFLFSPVRMLSPSRPYAGMPRDTRNASNSKAIEVFPAPEKPVNQTVHPRKPRHRPRFWPRRARVTWCFCSVTFVATCRHWIREETRIRWQFNNSNWIGDVINECGSSDWGIGW